jgi:hypothetical protein
VGDSAAPSIHAHNTTSPEHKHQSLTSTFIYDRPPSHRPLSTNLESSVGKTTSSPRGKPPRPSFPLEGIHPSVCFQPRYDVSSPARDPRTFSHSLSRSCQVHMTAHVALIAADLNGALTLTACAAGSRIATFLSINSNNMTLSSQDVY